MPFLPITDEAQRRWISYPYVTLLIVVSCTLVFLFQASQTEEGFNRLIYSLGTIPSVLFGIKELSPDLVLVHPALTLLTSVMLHGSFLHLFGNMLFLWVFGDNIEDSMGHGRFVVFYFLCGVLAALAQAVTDPASEAPTIGASGAVAGVLGAYMVLHPRTKVWVVLLIPIPFRLPSYVLLGLWIGLEILNALFVHPEEAAVAFWAHVGGFFAGAILIRWFKYPHVLMWGKGDTEALKVGGLRFKSRHGPWGERPE